jgi:hypothetical protein
VTSLEGQIVELRRRAELLPREDSRRIAARGHLRAAEDALKAAERAIARAHRELMAPVGERFGLSPRAG